MRHLVLLLLVVLFASSAWAEGHTSSEPPLLPAERLKLGNAAFDREEWEAAARWLMPLAVAGTAVAQRRIGYMYDAGKYFKQNSCIGTLWHDKAARQGDAVSAASLGWSFSGGDGVKRDHRQAYRWMFWASRNGSDWAMEQLDFVSRDLNDTQKREIEQEIADGWDPKAQPPAELFILTPRVHEDYRMDRYMEEGNYSTFACRDYGP